MTKPSFSDPIFVAGHRGLVGSAVVRALESAGYTNLITRRSSDLDLREQAAVRAFFASEQPRYVICAAAMVGGIAANNDFPGTFIYDNLAIQTNVIEACRQQAVKKLIYLGSTCIYPKHAPQPIQEEHLLTGPLEETNEAYAIAKIAGLKMCEAYAKQYGMSSITLMATNLYGQGDNFDLEKSHVIPALMRKAHEAKLADAKTMTVWGTGKPLREFLYVDDMAAAARYCLEHDTPYSMVNVGSGEEISIADLCRLICDVVGFRGELIFNPEKPDGTPRKLADSSRLRDLGWSPTVGLRDGLEKTYRWFSQTANARLGD
ncbi:MAG: GDP-L-fucose synthase [Alphaproteobacteria bacterium]|nr:GDP-L-fucose synthase [Alphaproteobacteria bacterium]